MAAPRKYPEELRERAVRMAVDLRKDPATKPGALRRPVESAGASVECFAYVVRQRSPAPTRTSGPVRRTKRAAATSLMRTVLSAQPVTEAAQTS